LPRSAIARDLPSRFRLETTLRYRGLVVRLAVALCALLLLAGCGTTTTKIEMAPTVATPFAGTELSPPRKAPPIALHDAEGRAVTLAGEHGRFVLVTFLYTHCPDVCPLIAQNLNTALTRLGADRSRVRVLAVSVDPKGDTPAAVRAYTKRMRLLPQFRYLIGSRANLRTVWSAWHVATLHPSPGVVSHVTYTALVDPRGSERVLYDASVRAKQVLHDLRVLMRTE
jgi:protein SCO1